MSEVNLPAPTTGFPEFESTRVFDAPRSLVFKAFSECKRLKEWWGPTGFTMMVANLDFRPGGHFHYCMRAPHGAEMWGKFVYREIVAPERVVFINSFSDESGGLTRHPMSPTWPLEVLSTLTLSEENGKTTLRLVGVAINCSEAERETFAAGAESMSKGFAGTWDQLDAYLATVRAPFVIERTFDAPIATVWHALTDKAAIKQWSFDFSDFKPEVGFEFTFEGGKDDRRFTHLSVVTEVVPQAKLSYTWRYAGYPGDSLLTFELYDEGNATRLRLTHEGLESFPNDPDFARSNFEAGWTAIIGSSLKDYLEANPAK